MKRTGLILLLLCGLLLLFTACGREEGTETYADGSYTVSVTLSGGSGRASVESPAQVLAEDGAFFATIVWSSPFYEFMLVDGVQYDPIQEEGNATFCIPVVLDTEMAVSAQTAAMSQPHLVDYTLFFAGDSLQQVTP